MAMTSAFGTCVKASACRCPMNPAPMMPTLTRSFAIPVPPSRILLCGINESDRHPYLPILDSYRVGAHAQPGRGEALTGDDVELDAVPRAGDDLTLAHP